MLVASANKICQYDSASMSILCKQLKLNQCEAMMPKLDAKEEFTHTTLAADVMRPRYCSNMISVNEYFICSVGFFSFC